MVFGEHFVHLITKEKPVIVRFTGFVDFDIEIGGELGIRTPGTFHSSTVFKTAAIDHSANSPGTKVQNRVELQNQIITFFETVFYRHNHLK